MGDFEVFSRKIIRGRGPSVTLARMGRFNFNKAAFTLFKERAVEDLLLMWDTKKRLIGFKPIPKKDARTYKMRYATRGDWCGFSSVSFLKHIGYKKEGSQILPVEWDEQEKMFIVEVPEEFLRKEKK